MSATEISPESFVHFPSWPTLRVVGPDAATWLNGIVTCDVLSATPERAVWGVLLTKQGKISAELQIVGGDGDLFLAVSGGDRAAVLEALEGYLVMEDAEIEPCDSAWIVGGGPASPRLREVGLRPAFVSWTDVGTFILHGPAAVIEQLREDPPATVLDAASFAGWKIRHGVPTFGADYGVTDNLHAASLERRTVDWQKGCYLGQEVVCMQDMRGKVKRRLVRVLSTGHGVASGAELFPEHGGDPVGKVTSSAGQVAIASVSAPHFEPGTTLLDDRGTVTVAALFPEPVAPSGS